MVAFRELSPSFVLLTKDVSDTGFPLRIKRVEALLEPLLRRLSGVYGVALADHDLLTSPRPKNFGPFRFIPVSAHATADREV